MKITLLPLILSATLAAGVSAPGTAEERNGADRTVITLAKADRHPATPRAARRVLARIGDAALTVCGAPSSSLADVKLAVRRSACWKDAVAGALAQINDPLLAQAYRDQNRS